MSESSSIKNILFDLGGVLLNIDYHKTIAAFNDLGWLGFADFYSQQQQKKLFDDLETGLIQQDVFFNQLSTYFKPIEYEKLETAWNAMLLDIPPARLKFLESLKEKYRLFLFSNTNAIHYQAFSKYLHEQHSGAELDNYFEKAYYSHLLGQRKPYPEAFGHILQENKLTPSETLFIDDSPQHLEGASLVGIKTYLFPQNANIIELFPDIIQSAHH
jgi:glucose-1-phosphatase